MPPPPPPALPDELVEEILLRTPPERLMRAALACKHWRRLVCAAGFRRRFRERHRTPPVLGVVCNSADEDGTGIARFVPTSSFLPRHAYRRGWRAMDSRHGRVLLHRPRLQSVGAFAVWDPVTDELRELPMLPLVPGLLMWNAVVLCSCTPMLQESSSMIWGHEKWL
ncbi:hypothetical protein ACP70R_046336 [Stipagrostis hirtigluma subsp. patula]